MTAETLQDLYVEQLRDLYDAENQLIKALPKMAEGTASEPLREAFEEHLGQTRNHVQRLEQIFEGLGEKAKAEKCKGMEGLVKEGGEVLDEDMDESVKDAAIISAAQKVEHYEIAGYGTVRTFANLLGEDEAAKVLEETLEEEKETDRKLTELAGKINVEAKQAEGAEGTEEKPTRPAAKSGTTTRRKRAA